MSKDYLPSGYSHALQSAKHPSQIGRYKVQEELGRGGFGRVYRAYDPTVGRPVAIKILTDVSADTQTRFRNEAMVAGNLRHKNIVTVYEYGSYEGLPFLAMEYLEGEDLHHIIASHKPLSLLEKCNIMSQVADGLYYAHSQRSGPSRHEARQHHGAPRWHREDHGFRHRAAHPHSRRDTPDAAGLPDRHSAVHGAGTTRRRRFRSPGATSLPTA